MKYSDTTKKMINSEVHQLVQRMNAPDYNNKYETLRKAVTAIVDDLNKKEKMIGEVVKLNGDFPDLIHNYDLIVDDYNTGRGESLLKLKELRGVIDVLLSGSDIAIALYRDSYSELCEKYNCLRKALEYIKGHNEETQEKYGFHHSGCYEPFQEVAADALNKVAK